MFEIVKHDDGIIEVISEGHFSAQSWEEYQAIMMELLDEANDKICVLSDFSKSPTFDALLVKEIGTAKHINHPNLGLLVLLGGNALHNFLFSLMESRVFRTMQENKDFKMRIERSREQALDNLRRFQNQLKQSDS